MNLETYYKLIEELEKHRGYGVHTGVEEVAAKLDQPYDATRAIRSQYLQRKSIRNHYKVKDKAGLHYNTWKDGRSISEIALDVDFPPILLANFLMLKMRYSKKRTKDQEKLVKYKARKSKKAAKKFKKNTVVKNGKTYDKSKNTTTSTKPTDAELMAHHEANRKKKGKSTE